MTIQSNGSGSAINELSRSKSRYQHQDQLLLGFMRQPRSTAKEIAAEVYDWKYERYADSPKRATDLASDKLGYLEQCDNRQCRRSGKDAHTYKITERGIAHLKKIGMLSGAEYSQFVGQVVNPSDSKAHLSAMSAMLQ